MKSFAQSCVIAATTILVTSFGLYAQEWGNNPIFSPTYTSHLVGIGFQSNSMERNLHIMEDAPPSLPIIDPPPIETWTAGIRLETYIDDDFVTGDNIWDIFTHPYHSFEIRNVNNNLTGLFMRDDIKAGLWQPIPRTMLHVGDYRQLTMGRTGGNGDGLWGEYIGFNTYLEQHEEAASTITKLGGGSSGNGGQLGGSLVATDYFGNLEIQTLVTDDEHEAVTDIAYDPQFIFTNQGVLEFRRSEERWTAKNWSVHMKAPISTAWVTTSQNDNGEHMGIGMTNTGWYFIRSNNAPGETNGDVDECSCYPFYVELSGKAVAREVEVKIDTWCDYVFEDDYELMPLESVESFVKQNRHLPDIPPEAEVLENGINLGEMNARLLKKVEELTLYIIEQQKQIQELSEWRNSLDRK